MDDRKQKQLAFYRVCKDSNFKMDGVEAAKFTAKLLKCSPFDIHGAVGSFQNLERIAKGEIDIS